MISEPYVWTDAEGMRREGVFEYHEADSFDGLPYGQCKQVRAVAYDPDLQKVFIVTNLSGKGWGHPGGSIEPGETFIETLERELVEETNTRLIRAIPIGYQKVVHTNMDKPEFYQLRYVAVVQKIGEFESDPASSSLKCKEILFEEIPKYVYWREIGDRIYTQAVSVLHL